MKRLLLSALIGTSFLAGPAFAGEKTPDMPAVEIVKAADVTVDLNGLVCDFCATALNKVFRKRDEVAYTHVDLDTKKLSVIFKDGQTLDDSTLEKLVNKAGYDMVGVTRAES